MPSTRVVVSVVDPAEVTAFALAHGITLVEGDQQATQWVANQIAISKAITETRAQKVITFHSRVAQAQVFASDTRRGIGQYLDGFVVDHVNGEMRVADRTDILSGFTDDQRRVVTNARCLTEGVDLPAIDMVAFCNPRRSRIDIIQAVGRAMRKPRDGTKALGYVVVPILLAPHQTEDLEAAARDTDWEDIVDVVAALREHDTRLEDLIRDAQIAKGRGEVFNPRPFSERVMATGPLVSLDVLERHIGAVVLERLGVSWDERFGQLVAFRAAHGHCNVPQGCPPNPTLGTWLSTQRRAKAYGQLSSDRIARLEAVGIVWEPYDAAWEEMYQALVQFQQREGYSNVPWRYSPNPRLSTWLTTQRKAKTCRQLSSDRIARHSAWSGRSWIPSGNGDSKS